MHSSHSRSRTLVQSDDSDIEVNKVEQAARNAKGPAAAREFFVLAKVYRYRKLPDMAPTLGHARRGARAASSSRAWRAVDQDHQPGDKGLVDSRASRRVTQVGASEIDVLVVACREETRCCLDLLIVTQCCQCSRRL